MTTWLRVVMIAGLSTGFLSMATLHAQFIAPGGFNNEGTRTDSTFTYTTANFPFGLSYYWDFSLCFFNT